MIRKSIRLAQPSSPVREELRAVEIPRHLPPTVRDVAESLLMRDPESAKRYLEAHLSQKNRTKRDDSTFDLIEDN
jgi:hypothetical protein